MRDRSGRFYFLGAANAAGVAPKRLRRWIEQGGLRLDAAVDRSEDAWRKFSCRDIIYIRILTAMVDIGVYAGDAKEVAADAIDNRLIVRAGDLITFEEAMSRLAQKSLIFWRHNGEAPDSDSVHIDGKLAWKVIGDGISQDGIPAAFSAIDLGKMALAASEAVKDAEAERAAHAATKAKARATG